MNLINLIILLPIAGAFFSALCIFSNQQKKSEIISTVFVSISALFSILAYINLQDYAGTYHLYNWFKLGGKVIDFSILYDPLTAIMFLVVTLVSALVHIFSIGYITRLLVL